MHDRATSKTTSSRLTRPIPRLDLRARLGLTRLVAPASLAVALLGGLQVAFQAMALARPVISTYVAGIPELVRDGVDGWLVPAGPLGRDGTRPSGPAPG